MIFVSVGTHEQPMDRLFAKLEAMVQKGALKEPVIVQSGYSNFQFEHCEAKKLIPIQEIDRQMVESRVVVCHGGPATIMQARAAGKVPVVVPRQACFGEHVNDHQVHFCERLQRLGLIRLVLDIEQLPDAIEAAASARPCDSVAEMGSGDLSLNRDALCRRLIEWCDSLKISHSA